MENIKGSLAYLVDARNFRGQVYLVEVSILHFVKDLSLVVRILAPLGATGVVVAGGWRATYPIIVMGGRNHCCASHSHDTSYTTVYDRSHDNINCEVVGGEGFTIDQSSRCWCGVEVDPALRVFNVRFPAVILPPYTRAHVLWGKGKATGHKGILHLESGFEDDSGDHEQRICFHVRKSEGRFGWVFSAPYEERLDIFSDNSLPNARF